MFSHKDAYEERSEEYLADKRRKKQLAAASASAKADPEAGLKDSLLQNADATANRDSKELEKTAKAENAVGESNTDDDDDDDEEDEDEDLLGFRPALFWLAVITVFIAILSELISDSIEDGAKSIGRCLFCIFR